MWLKPRNRRKQPERATRPPIRWDRLLWVGGTMAALTGAVLAVTWALDQPIRSVAVSGRFERVAPGDVERVVKAQVRGSGLLSVDLAAVRRALRSLPWVDSVNVERAWPHGLNVLVIEQVAAARWGERGLLNTRGELFAPEEPRIPPELARLDGPPGSEARVARRYLDAAARLQQAGVRLTAVRLSARGAWEFELANGIVVRLGRRDVDERFQRFMAAAVKLVTQRAADIAYLDMRYTNGFAIGWRGSAPRTEAGGTHDA